jgi:hypothetical protein
MMVKKKSFPATILPEFWPIFVTDFVAAVGASVI